MPAFSRSGSAAVSTRPTSSSARWSAGSPASASIIRHYLGKRLVDIAGEKAGIAKRGVPLVTQNYAPRITKRIGEVAEAAGALFLPRGHAWDARVRGGRLNYRDGKGECDLPLPALPGRHQARNAALAVAMLRHHDVLPVTAQAMAQGVGSAQWAGRLQVLQNGPLAARLPGRRIWLDGGHNRKAALAIAREMRQAPFDLIFALTATRRIADVLGPFASLVRMAHAVPLPGHAHHDPRDIAMVAQGGLGPRHCYPAFSLDQAIERLAADHDGARDVLIFGSLYLAGEVLAANDQVPD